MANVKVGIWTQIEYKSRTTLSLLYIIPLNYLEAWSNDLQSFIFVVADFLKKLILTSKGLCMVQIN